MADAKIKNFKQSGKHSFVLLPKTWTLRFM